MKIRLFSDLHICFEPFRYEYAGEDLVILAGDIHTKNRHAVLLKQIPKDVPIIMVAGNHSHFHSVFQDTIKFLYSLEKDFPNFTFLNNEWIIHKTIPIYGGTMFSDFNLFNTSDQSALIAKHDINDFHMIKKMNEGGVQSLWSPKDHLAEHKKFVEGLDNFTNCYGNKKRIVISHFLPSSQCVSPEYTNDPLTPYYATNMDRYFGDANLLFVFGHTHTSFDLRLGDSRVISNPKGYYDENKDFNPNLVIEF